MDLLRVEFVSCGETSDIKEEDEQERMTVKEEDEQERMTVPVIKTEPKVSCVLGECMHISYRLYPECSAPLSVYACETKIWI
jgi:hypothetical protein